MSVDEKSLEAALRSAFEAALPGLVRATLARLHDGTSSASRRVADHEGLRRLFDVAREGGEAAVLAQISVEPDELRALAAAMDRVLAARYRKLKDVERMRRELAAEIHRRAFRNEVFRHREEGV